MKVISLDVRKAKLLVDLLNRCRLSYIDSYYNEYKKMDNLYVDILN